MVSSATNGIKRAKTSRGKRHVAAREPSLLESDKICALFKGGTLSNVLSEFFHIVKRLKTPSPVVLEHLEAKPLDDPMTLDKSMRKGNFSLFMYGSSTKKNPTLVTLGRYFDGRVLDMFEFKITNFISIDQVAQRSSGSSLLSSIPAGSIPILSFYNFDVENLETNRIRNLFIDFFNGGRQTLVSPSQLTIMLHITCTSQPNLTFDLRIYKVTQRRDADVQLHLLGPCCDIAVTRTHFAEDQLLHDSLKQPKRHVLHTPKKVKNVERDDSGGIVGKIHMQVQDLSSIKAKRVKAFRRGVIAKTSA